MDSAWGSAWLRLTRRGEKERRGEGEEWVGMARVDGKKEMQREKGSRVVLQETRGL